MIGLGCEEHEFKNLSWVCLKMSYNDLNPNISRRVLMLSHLLKPKIRRNALFIAKLQSDISEAE